jgi:hypothetical protein
MPLQRRIPKRGFKNINRVAYQVVNVRDLSRIEAGEVTPAVLHHHGLIGSLRHPVKVLGMGEVEGAYQVSAHGFSEAAREKIEGAGGTVTMLPGVGEKGGHSAPPEPASGEAGETEAQTPDGDEAPETEEEKA